MYSKFCFIFRFALKSLESGLIVSSFDFGSLLVVVIVSYFGGHGNRPTWLGFGALLVATGKFLNSVVIVVLVNCVHFILFYLGGVIFSLPHFISPDYDISQAPSYSQLNNSGMACAHNSSYLPEVVCDTTVSYCFCPYIKSFACYVLILPI